MRTASSASSSISSTVIGFVFMDVLLFYARKPGEVWQQAPILYPAGLIRACVFSIIAQERRPVGPGLELLLLVPRRATPDRMMFHRISTARIQKINTDTAAPASTSQNRSRPRKTRMRDAVQNKARAGSQGISAANLMET